MGQGESERYLVKVDGLNQLKMDGLKHENGRSELDQW